LVQTSSRTSSSTLTRRSPPPYPLQLLPLITTGCKWRCRPHPRLPRIALITVPLTLCIGSHRSIAAADHQYQTCRSWPPRWAPPPPISSRPSDLDLVTRIRSLCEEVSVDLIHPDLFWSNIPQP
jgi:hypothetical protein